MLLPLLECFNDLSNVKDRQHSQLGICVSAIMGLVEIMTTDHYRWLKSSFEVKEDLEVMQIELDFKIWFVFLKEFILTSFHTYSEIIGLTGLHPPEWSSLRFLHNQ